MRNYSAESNNNTRQILFSVQDAGCGIPQEMHKKVFERFFQIRNSTTEKQGGTGLGLAICKELVELMGGKIWIDPDYHKGTLVHFYIAAEIYAGEISTNSQFTIPTHKIATKKEKFSILVAEDDLVNRTVIQKMLQRSGFYDITIANNGREAVAIAEQNKFDIVLMDVQMPEIDGIEATKIIRSRNLLSPKTPIIAVTAAATPEDAQKCMAAGMNGILMMPIAMVLLTEVLEKYYIETKEVFDHMN